MKSLHTTPDVLPNVQAQNFPNPLYIGGGRENKEVVRNIVMDVDGGYCGEPLTVEATFSSSGSISKPG